MVEFQVLCWEEYDGYGEFLQRQRLDETLERFEGDNDYFVELFGKTADGRSVMVRVAGFEPFLCVKVPEDVADARRYKAAFEAALRSIHLKDKGSSLRLAGSRLLSGRRSFDHYRPDATETFLELRFPNRSTLRWALRVLSGQFSGKCARCDVYQEYGRCISCRKCVRCSRNRCARGECLRTGVQVDYNARRYTRFQLYEGNLPPFIHMMHQRGLQACGWVRAEGRAPADRRSNCDLELECRPEQLHPVERSEYAPLKVMSYDIECDVERLDHKTLGEDDKDAVIMIGCTFNRLFETRCYRRVLLTLSPLDAVPDAEVVHCRTERELLLRFKALIAEEAPDIVTGYNLVGFDDLFIRRRVAKLELEDEFDGLGRTPYRACQFVSKHLESAGLGRNRYDYYQFTGIAKIDLMKIVQRDYKLDSAKLDAVSEHFINGPAQLDGDVVTTDSTELLRVNNYVRFKDLTHDQTIRRKFRVLEVIDGTRFRIEQSGDPWHQPGVQYRWGMVKDDMDAALIGQCYRRQDRAELTAYGEYCLQDCELCNKLMEKLFVVLKNMEMANVSNVPLDYIIYRGQGIKAHSLVGLFCKRAGFLIPVLTERKEADSYEGACVFDPEPGFYVEAITVLDFSSLYPSSMIELNMSHDTILEGAPAAASAASPAPPHHAVDIRGVVVDEMLEERSGTVRTHRFVTAEVQKGVVPQILEYLLDARKRTKKKMKAARGTNLYAIYDGQQLAFKVTANSIYGQMGALTSPVAKRPIAESTTARGRAMLEFAKDFVCRSFPQYREAQEFCAKEGITIAPVVVYGDTDSNFINYHVADAASGQPVRGPRVLQLSIELGKLTEACIANELAYPHSWAYEKVYYPFLIQKKKRYLGILYEEDVTKGKLYYMGIELKRRDNAYILKRMMKGIVNYLMDAVNRPVESFQQDIVQFIERMVQDIYEGRYDIHDFVITKTFKDSYKNPDSLAHAVLAKRMQERDPMTAPKSNDRIRYVYVRPTRAMSVRDQKNLKDKDHIEEVDYVIKHGLRVDYNHYVSKHLVEPCCKLLEGVLPNPQRIFMRFVYRYEKRQRNEDSGQRELTAFFAPEPRR